MQLSHCFYRWLTCFGSNQTLVRLVSAIQLAVGTHQLLALLAVDALLVLVLLTVVLGGLLHSFLDTKQCKVLG
jgi:uncharacterized membrane protein